MANLFDPLDLGPLSLTNRVVMAPMTRGRAQRDGTPNGIQATYYAQRATAGLLVTEGTFVSRQGGGWVNAPGIYTDAHEAAWRQVPAAVHAAGGKIFLQLWHMGRVVHPDFLDGELPVGPSAIAAAGEAHTYEGKKAYVTPRALDAGELAGVAEDFAQAARRAVAAGFDGVEIHGANGYLLDQFIRDGANQRTDDYGGSVEARWRFPLEVVDAVVAAVGAERTGIRVSPTNPFNDMRDSDPVASFAYGGRELAKRDLAYLHVVEPASADHMMADASAPAVAPTLREVFGGALILNGGFDRASADAALESGAADAVAFGVPFIANPDLPARLLEGAPIAMPDFAKLYSPGPEGYTDYPALGQ